MANAASLRFRSPRSCSARLAITTCSWSIRAFGKNTEKDIWAQVAPSGGEPFVVTFLDKFIGTDLNKILKDKGIKTVIVVGSAANGAAFGTASGAAQRGYSVIVPVDGISSDNLYAEQSAVWNMANAPVISSKITLTTVDMMKF